MRKKAGKVIDQEVNTPHTKGFFYSEERRPRRSKETSFFRYRLLVGIEKKREKWLTRTSTLRKKLKKWLARRSTFRTLKGFFIRKNDVLVVHKKPFLIAIHI